MDKKRQEDLKMNCKWKIIITTVIVVMIIGIIGLVIYEENVEMPENVISLEHNAFDDQYVGCEETMEMRAKELLAQERAMNSNFNEVWENAEIEWENMSTEKKRMKMPFEVAVIAYTMEKKKIYPAFNQAVRKCCASWEAYMNNFHFKALHFYLTRAVQILKRSCKDVYRGISVKQYPDGTGEMRFGQLASTSLKQYVARRFTNGSGTLYKVHTCEGAPIEHLSAYPDEKEVLIPPYEVFNVSRFSESEGFQNVELKSTRTFSKFNCAYLEAFGNKAAVRGQLTTILFSGVLTLVFQAHSQTLTEL
ncbi:ecto-ADP-ribosyltransferase 5-like isoform X2 [Phascolarctos cinereus]|uniref:NAD(P)(+)--arginine ADP-ribosyltransferase n=1 Tax=Phascolarctos cinereus TaxID=38626 RepID=A0A6P5IN13_PHACI|nr:ecto-ADP-ribosyltransferase 5-like isoform X2 [Phascolarctos cinereus]XP_020823448.1 ecto-ADP-ribosyltransferase 5-like isoform X2 [Phascolarctos cinereus]XP_020823449.1 ecto-ADP-ribosyltransferase 5-like isoform X2 [Phascolarctos cinereus]XP_020823450.1 ecto-ADP-ribosyltransferase 5-like isoform X2 [Phascolarctos cinereus]XP_020823452.1 ecto-ADP-ribosyltransferase 5-like isoform X2 [Phascolarctos cinereus]